MKLPFVQTEIDYIAVSNVILNCTDPNPANCESQLSSPIKVDWSEPYYDISLNVPGLHGSLWPSIVTSCGGLIVKIPTTTITWGQGSVIDYTLFPDDGYSVVSVSGCNGTWDGANNFAIPSLQSSCTITATFSSVPLNCNAPIITATILQP